MPRRKSKTDEPTPRKKKKKTPIEIDAEEDTPSDPIEDYPHGSHFKGDTPPPWVAACIEGMLAGNPYRDMPTDELEAIARDLYPARERLALIERVLCARSSAW